MYIIIIINTKKYETSLTYTRIMNKHSPTDKLIEHLIVTECIVYMFRAM